MKTLSNTGRKIAQRSFAVMMAVLICATSFGTNFWGLGSGGSESIVGSFDAFAADNVTYGPSQTYYDAGKLVMNAYYDSSTGTKLSETAENYHTKDWDVTSATSYVAGATQNGNKGITILSTTDVANSGKYGSASDVVAGGDGENGIMCFSEYLNALNGSAKPGNAEYKAYEKAVPDYEAPAGVDTMSYQYIAEGNTTTTDDGQVEIKWTLFAWPDDQNLDNTNAAAIKAKLDTPDEIKAEWAKVGVTDITGNNSVVLRVPGELVKTADAQFQDAGKAGAKDTASLFYKGQPEWLSGNKGSFDSWMETAHETYLMNLGLWSRLETAAVTIKKAGDAVSYDGTPGVSIAMFAPDNKGTEFSAASYKEILNEGKDTENLPLYAYLGDSFGTADKLSSMSLSGILRGQSSDNMQSVVVPTYNIRKQLHAIWNTTASQYLKNASSLTCRQVTDGTTTAEKAFGPVDVTGVRLYAIAAVPRVDKNKANTNKTYIDASTDGKYTADITGTDQWVSAAQDGVFYGKTGAGATPVMFVFNEHDISEANGIVHVDKIPYQVFNLTDLYAAYDNSLAGTGAVVANDVPNIMVPYSIRSDAYYDVTEDYQRAAGVLYGRTEAAALDTSAVNGITHSKMAIPANNDKIIDTVTYGGLEAGKAYQLEGTIYNKNDTAMATKIATGTVNFVASASAGTQDVEFLVNSIGFTDGSEYVVTEVLKDGDGNVIMEHKDLNDADQTIRYTTDPVVATKASLSDEDTKITDEVVYSGLNAAGEYTLNTTVFDKTANHLLAGNVATDFTAEDSGNGTLTVVFDKYDADLLTGHTLVVYESITDKMSGSVVATHADKEDAAQTVTIGANIKISTVAKSGTGSKYLDAIDSETITDEVTVAGLRANTEYTAKATLYDVTADALVTDTASNTLAWTKTFTTDAAGKASVTLILDKFLASGKAGHTLVVYEDIIGADGSVLMSHADKADEDQTVVVRKAGIETTLTDKEGNKDMESSASMVFKDSISYSELVPGNKYYMVSTLVDKTTGEVMKDKTGNQSIVKSTVFIANSTGTNQGSSSFTFSNMADAMSGKTVVAYNDLYRVLDSSVASGTTITDAIKTELVASERDPENVAQTVAIDGMIDITDATITTVAKGSDGEKTIPLATNATIKDTVTYTGLKAGKTYTLTADVYDTSTGKRAAGYNKEITMDFTAADTGKGSVVMIIDLNTTELSGHKLVVYETLTMGDITVASHRDLTDKDQTVTVGEEYQASIDTVATDKATGGKTIMASSDAVILDKVTYSGLDPEQTYKLTSTVYDKATGDKVDVKEVVTEFKPKDGDKTKDSKKDDDDEEDTDGEGTIEVSIPVDGTKFTAGQSLVVYEKLTTKSKSNDTDKTKTVTVAEHKDISDADQTVTVVKMSTYLTGDGTSAKTVHVGSDAYAIDTASFTGLTPNRTYVITTQLLDVAAGSTAVTLDTNTNNTSTASGSAVATRTMEFTPTTANGSISTQINVNTTELSGHSLVAVATVKDKATGKVVASHNDTANQDQTITVQTRVEAQTGVGSYAWIFGMMVLIILSAFASYGIGFFSDKRNRR